MLPSDKDQMSLLEQERLQPQMLPAVQSAQYTLLRKYGELNGPQHVSDVEAKTAQQARKKIAARLTIAKLFHRYRAQLIYNKHNVTVTADTPTKGEKICLTVYDNNIMVPLTVKNSEVKMVYLSFWASELVKDIFTVSDCHGNMIKTLTQLPLRPGEAYQIQVHFNSEHAGFYEQLLVFKFETRLQSTDTFEVMRLLEINQRTSYDEEPLTTVPDSLCDIETVKWVPVEGFNYSLLPMAVPLKGYEMPDSIKDLKQTTMELEKMPLNWGNYPTKFHLLLHLEELQQKTEIEKYNQDAPLFRHKDNRDLLILKIACAAKNSHSRLVGNKLRLCPLNPLGGLNETSYEAWVCHVDLENMWLQCNKGFLSCFRDGMRFRFLFFINRMPLRNQHRAVELVQTHRLMEVLFPTGKFSSHHSRLDRLIELESNPEQCNAVLHIVAASAKPSPYLVFGPPGTGKTVTLVEAIKQIVTRQPCCHILACAPSNSAADHLCEKIRAGSIPTSMVYRLYALSYPVANIPPKSLCNLQEKTKTLLIPHKEILMWQRILVTTLQTAGRLVSGGIPPGHFTYLFVDEAGQATETECIIPLAGLLDPQTCQLVLAGDPKQLGPILSSVVAEKHGLGVSMLERLMNNIVLYKSHETHGFNNRFVSKLLRNYRSHPAILKIPNELFYAGQLQPYADKATYSAYCDWECLPRKGFPLIFHGVAGTDERDHNCPSVYNMAEVEVLKDYLKALVRHFRKKGVTKIEPNEIGIITPYTKQVEKIKNALQTDKDLRQENLENIMVGSVEKFQGKECNVILVSTVRSYPKLTAHKQQVSIGFVDNEKRFNVALTRAQALLIVVGDPRVLKTEPIWNKFIHYCSEEGGYRGITVSDGEEEEEEEEDALPNVHSE
ncbi:putative helicase mov-10-B.1 isoform X1 [Pseudochaenichthys georgianus]|uniref:putative helicase mov-10-B.1 isoform X1 n=1 Tax=Pseudochaenichthys georgianus TaxID=52239 RepID=UPI00146E3A85|nr:putative helicase mov-10-B.1 isoform X1 [Pseudochaenichthys georgianus]